MYDSYTIVFQSVPQWGQDVRSACQCFAASSTIQLHCREKLKLRVTMHLLQLFQDQSQCLPGFRTDTIEAK